MANKKTIDIHSDQTMFMLNGLVREALFALVTYVQTTTPYGDEYKLAYSKLSEVSSLLSEAEEALQGCVEAKAKGAKDGE